MAKSYTGSETKQKERSLTQSGICTTKCHVSKEFYHCQLISERDKEER